MDPVSQGALGTVLPQAVKIEKNTGWLAAGMAFVAGVAPDLDILIRSETDPLLFLEYHRHFTHSLIFIPVGALVIALGFHFLFMKKHLPWKSTYLICLLSYGTHGFLDSCTSYGTQLFWPFTDYRVAWNLISIIDPLLTLPLLVFILLAILKKKPLFARIGLGWTLFYLLLGVVQRERAESVAWELARSRGHEPSRLVAKPSFGNLLVWKNIYEHDGTFYLDAIRVGFGSKVIPGDSIKKLEVDKDLAWLDPGSVQYRDIGRFSWFSDGFVALDPENPNLVMDVRYSFVPNQVNPLWGILLDPEKQGEHVRYHEARDLSPERRGEFWNMLFD